MSSKATVATHSVRAEPVEALSDTSTSASTGSARTDVLARAKEIAAQIPDPEIPVITLADLGVLRGVREENGEIVVTLTPTYAGCPAMHQMQEDLRAALAAQGIAARVETVLTPAWTTDWITAAAREKLRAYGIAPPHARPAADSQPMHFQARVQQTPRCPNCSSDNTERLSQFGSTACKALYRCRACKEPFDYFKPY